MKIAASIIAAGLIALPAGPGMAQAFVDGLGPALGDLSRSMDPGGSGSGELSGRIIQLMGLLTLLSIAPGLMIVMTSFTRFVIVLSMLRSALGLGQTPPSMVITSLAMFMTFFVMQPVFTDAWEDGLAPLIEGSIDERQAVPRIAEPFRNFMLANVREKDLALFARMSADNDRAQFSAEDMSAAEFLAGDDDAATGDELGEVAWSTLVPAFMISELRRAFIIGVLIFLPFVFIDLIVASILMGAGMMMLSPVMISLPFKVIFFVAIDGWYMLAGSLMNSYAAY